MPLRQRDRGSRSSGTGRGPGTDQPGGLQGRPPPPSLYLWVGQDGALFVVREWNGRGEWVTTTELSRALDELAELGDEASVIYARERPDADQESPEVARSVVRLITERRLLMQIRPDVVHPEVVEYLRKHERFIHWAAYFGKVDALADLAARGAPLNVRDGDGNTPLVLAVRQGHVEAARVLLDAGANVRSVPNDGATAIMVAAERGDEVVARLLVEHGARPLRAERSGSSAVDLARHAGHGDLAAWLEQAGPAS